MIAKLPIIQSVSSCPDVICAAAHAASRRVGPDFEARLASSLQAEAVHTLNSGIASFFVILEALKTMSSKQEVIVPAYTAGSLVVGIQKAGLKPVLCDVSLDDLNADRNDLSRAVSADTLAVVAVHMFGIPIGYLDTLKTVLPSGVFVIEDCCQAMGSRIKDRAVGSLSDIAFFSFNRGKNLPANNGGCVIVRNPALTEPVRQLMQDLPAARAGREAVFRAALFMIGTAPLVYGLGHAFAAGFREDSPPQDIEVRVMDHFQCALGLRALARAENLFLQRARNGSRLLRKLAGVPGLKLPRIRDDLFPVFNRLPIVFDDDSLVERARTRLWQQGIEASRMYRKPLHHMFDLGYDRDAFENARFVSGHLLTLPVHPGVTMRHIDVMSDTIKGLV